MDKRRIKTDIQESDEFDFKEENLEISESYLQEAFEDLVYDSIVESLEIFRTYTYDKGLPIGEKLTFNDLADFFFV
jgi:hypothetical protein